MAELRAENASLIPKPKVFESDEDHIVYMTKLYLPGLLDSMAESFHVDVQSRLMLYEHSIARS